MFDVGSVLATIGRPEEAALASGDTTVAQSAPSVAAQTTQTSTDSVDTPVSKVFATPRARKAADELGVDLAQLKGSGPGGRILERDVLGIAPAEAPIAADVLHIKRLAQIVQARGGFLQAVRRYIRAPR